MQYLVFISIVPKREEAKKKGRAVNSIDSALDPKNFDKIELPKVLKKFTVPVKSEVRVSGKIDWVNKKPQATAGQSKRQNIIPDQIGVTGAAA